DVAPAAQLAEKLEQRPDCHLAVQPALLRKISHQPGARRRHRLAKNAHMSAIRVEDVDDHADRGGFTAAIGPNESEYRVIGDGKREVIDRSDFSETLGDIRNLDGVHSG